MNSRLFFYWLLLAVLMIALPACTAAPTPVPTLAPTLPPVPSQTETPRPSETKAPTQTPTPTATFTLSPTATATPTQVSTPSLTPQPVFAGFKVDYADYTYYGLLLAMNAPGIKENYRLDVNGVKYTCTYNPKLITNLNCYGPQFPPATVVKLTFMPLTGSDQAVYETTYKIVPYATPTLDPAEVMAAAGGGTCAVRGVNVSCETEYRALGSGYCIVATCVDTCGYYFSVHTCPENMPWNGIYIFPPGVTPPLPPSRGK